jgi:hypothetical protein
MSPTLDETFRRFMAVGRKVLRTFAPALLAVTVLTVVASAPAGAHAPGITKPGAPRAVTATVEVQQCRGRHRFLTAVPPSPATR